MDMRLLPGTSADVMIWDEHGPSPTHGQVFAFEIGGYGAPISAACTLLYPVLTGKF